MIQSLPASITRTLAEAEVASQARTNEALVERAADAAVRRRLVDRRARRWRADFLVLERHAPEQNRRREDSQVGGAGAGPGERGELSSRGPSPHPLLSPLAVRLAGPPRQARQSLGRGSSARYSLFRASPLFFARALCAVRRRHAIPRRTVVVRSAHNG